MLQVLARSATGERMNPYTSLWTGVTPGDGPQRFHVVLLDNGRSSILARPKHRQTLKCIRCAACMNACPVYRQTGGHAYGSVYPGPIGAILTPQLTQMHHAQTLPYASSLCGACYEVCPVKINIPEVLLELRAEVVNQERKDLGRFFDPMYLGLRMANLLFSRAWIFHTAQWFGRIGLGLFTRKDGWIHSLPVGRGQMDPNPRPARAPRPDLSRLVGSKAEGGQMSVHIQSRSEILKRIRDASHSGEPGMARRLRLHSAQLHTARLARYRGHPRTDGGAAPRIRRRGRRMFPRRTSGGYHRPARGQRQTYFCYAVWNPG